MQLLFWNPLETESVKDDVEDMKWFRDIARFGLDDDETESRLQKDPDRRLLSLVIEKVVLPKVTSVVKSAYDPMSTSQTIKVVSLIKHLMAEFPSIGGESKQLRQLLEIARDRLKVCVESDPYVPIGYNRQIKETPNGPHAIFVQRQFWSCIKLFRNALSWNGILADGVLIELTIVSLLNRYLLIALGLLAESSPVLNKCRAIASVIPNAWIRQKPSPVPELAGFSRYLQSLAKALLKSGAGRDTIIEASELLRYIGCPDEADQVRKSVK